MGISIIIVSWKVRERLQKCLESIFKYTSGVNLEVFVVDNNSGDGSAEMVAGKFPQVWLIANKKNVGFAAAVNQAAREAHGEFTLLLNPDTEIFENIFEKMAAYMREHPDVGVLGPRLLGGDGKLQPSVRRFPILASSVLILLKLHHFFPRLGALKRYFMDDMNYETEADVEQIMGACFMIRADLFKKLGLLDERFFTWFEEVDFCKRALAAGAKVRYVPFSGVRHFGGESFAHIFSLKKQKMFNDSLVKFFKKHHSWPEFFIIKIFTIPSFLLAFVLGLIKTTKAVSKNV